jgi:uncharacterized membrane protein
MSRARVETFSDGVFAIAITLLVLTIAQPAGYRDLGHELSARWPALGAYVVSFAVIGIMWLNHHAVLRQLARLDRGAVYLNLVLLMTVAFLPYPTGVLGQALAKGQSARTAAVFYGVTMRRTASPGRRSGSTDRPAAASWTRTSPRRSAPGRRCSSPSAPPPTRWPSASPS